MSQGDTGLKSLAERERLERILLSKMKKHAADLQNVLTEANDDWGYEDGIYRFYYQSFKVFAMQNYTEQLVNALRSVAPEQQQSCAFFEQVCRSGLGREFKPEDNDHWIEVTAPIVQAFLHARYFVEMAVKYAAILDEPPQPMPSGWAALLCLYEIR
jgi:hypothetical protein